MALQVWLPLNGEFENIGLDDIQVTASEQVYSFDQSGKIGSCLTGYNVYIGVGDLAGKKQMSVAYWVRVNIATETQWLDAFRWNSTDGTSNHVSRNEFHSNCTKTGFWFKGGSISSKPNTVGKWQHHAFSIDYTTGEANFYINGELVGTSNSVDTTHYIRDVDCRLGESGLDTSFNDFRLYDHILSAKEVKELSKGLMAHYPLNDFLDDNVVYDCSGYGNNGINIGASVETNSSRYTSALSFDGEDDYVRLPNPSWPVVFKSDFTISLWVFARDTTRGILFSNYSISNGGNFFCIELYTNLAVRLWWTTSGIDGHIDKRNFGTVTLNEWNHIAIAFNNSTFYVYINGSLGGSVEYTGTATIPDGATEFRLGADGRTTGTTNLYGSLSDVRVYATALSAEDVKELYQTSASVDQNGRLFSYELVED